MSRERVTMHGIKLGSNRTKKSETRFAAVCKRAAGFTLLELLIALSILLIVAGLTMKLLNSTLDSDRVRAGARELQSYLAGARDRAIYAGQPRGVRLIPDPIDPSTVRSFVYIGAPSAYTDGSLIAIAANGQIASPPLTWQPLASRGMLLDGTPITIAGNIYSLSQNPPNSGVWYVTKSYAPAGVPVAYSLQLQPSILSGDEPRSLPQGIVVDLNNSVLPPSWGSPGAYTPQLDILFSPGGTVIGPVASAGRIHFVLSEFVDASVPAPATSAVTGIPLLDATAAWKPSTNYAVEQWVVPSPQNDLVFRCTTAGMSGAAQPAQFAIAVPGQSVTDNGVTWQCYLPKRRLVVSLATDTGRVTTSPVSPTDKFRYAEIGEVTQ